MRIRFVHLWLLAIILFTLSLFMGFSGKPLGAIFFAALWISVLFCTRWGVKEGINRIIQLIEKLIKSKG